MNVSKYISDLVKMARLTDAGIIIKRKLSIKYNQDKPPADIIFIQNIANDLDLIDGDGVFLIDSDGQHIQTV